MRSLAVYAPRNPGTGTEANTLGYRAGPPLGTIQGPVGDARLL